MNTTNPATWHDLSTHPRFSGGEFDPSWYDGHVEADLAMLRQVAMAIVEEYPNARSELLVLDDCTIYVETVLGNGIRCEIFPALSDNNKPCYFVDVEGYSGEVRVKTSSEVIAILNRFST